MCPLKREQATRVSYNTLTHSRLYCRDGRKSRSWINYIFSDKKNTVQVNAGQCAGISTAENHTMIGWWTHNLPPSVVALLPWSKIGQFLQPGPDVWLAHYPTQAVVDTRKVWMTAVSVCTVHQQSTFTTNFTRSFVTEWHHLGGRSSTTLLHQPNMQKHRLLGNFHFIKIYMANNKSFCLPCRSAAQCHQTTSYSRDSMALYFLY